MGWTLAAVGFYFQYTQMFSPPFVVELLLWPLQTIEYGLLYASRRRARRPPPRCVLSPKVSYIRKTVYFPRSVLRVGGNAPTGG